jgi:hypothetical protein
VCTFNRPIHDAGAFVCNSTQRQRRCVAIDAAQASRNEAGFISSGQTATLDCVGGKAEIVGNNNALTITGRCSNLDLAGSENKITIEFGPAAKVSIVGSNNAIIWTSVDGKPPTISSVGAANALTPRAP